MYLRYQEISKYLKILRTLFCTFPPSPVYCSDGWYLLISPAVSYCRHQNLLGHDELSTGDFPIVYIYSYITFVKISISHDHVC